MKQFSWLPTSIAALGSGVAVAITILHYAEAHRAGVHGGYFALWLGALGAGVVAGVTSYLSAPKVPRVASKAATVAIGVALATAGVLAATLISAFGS